MKIPEKYLNLKDTELISKIEEIKAKYDNKLIILAHHYQRTEIINLAHFIGDSFELSKKASLQKEADYIVFCGVHFMAEAAKILAKDKIIFLPDHYAGCPMADMAEDDAVRYAWENITKIIGGKKIVPITYMNSKASLKAFCGEKGGCVCTSSNATQAFLWAFRENEKLFFFPDEHLGKNTANKLKIPKNEIIVWDQSKPDGGNTKDKIKNASLILWKGYCHVHTNFTIEHINKIRREKLSTKIIVHPECTEDVVNASDHNGSTGFIVDYVNKEKSRTTIAIGTEINLVMRLKNNNPDKEIFPLARSLCPNMYKINLYNLLYTLENIPNLNEIKIAHQISAHAKLALDKMLEI
jgi:quinolinate synthase